MEEHVEVRIDALAAGGDGVGRDASGRVVFVPMTAPGDRVQVRLSERKERFARGRVETLLEPGPGRTTPRCSAFGRCGGCDWQHLSYPVQCRAKEAIARDALTRIGGLAAPPLRWFASPRIYGYRERARIAVTGKQVGFREGRSHKIAPVDQCPVLLPALDTALQDLVAAPPGDDADGGDAGTAADWELAVDREGAALATPLAGERAERELCIGDEVLTVSTGAFTQANPFLIEAWSRYICDAAGVGHRVLELFAGVGTLSLPLARRASSLVAARSSGGAACHGSRARSLADPPPTRGGGPRSSPDRARESGGSRACGSRRKAGGVRRLRPGALGS